MENLDLTQTVQPGASGMLTAGGILVLSAIIVLSIVIVKRWNGRVIPAIFGVLAYSVFVFIFANLFTSVLILIPSIEQMFDYNRTAYQIVYAMAVAVGYTVARMVMSYLLKDRYERRGDIYFTGIGLAIGECLIYGMTVITYITWCTALSSDTLEHLLAEFSGDEMIKMYQSIEMLFTAPAVLWLLMGVSYVLDIVLNIALLHLVYGAVKGFVPKWWIGASMGVQFLASVSFQVYQAESLVSILLCFGVKVIVFVAAVYGSFRMAGQEIAYEDDKSTERFNRR